MIAPLPLTRSDRSSGSGGSLLHRSASALCAGLASGIHPVTYSREAASSWAPSQLYGSPDHRGNVDRSSGPKGSSPSGKTARRPSPQNTSRVQHAAPVRILSAPIVSLGIAPEAGFGVPSSEGDSPSDEGEDSECLAGRRARRAFNRLFFVWRLLSPCHVFSIADKS